MRLVLDSLPDRSSSFWSSGNRPTQECFSINYTLAAMHFRSLYLLSDRVFASASFYYESEITRVLFSKHQSIFFDGDAMFFVNEEYDKYLDHGEAKLKKSPLPMRNIYTGDAVRKHSRVLDTIGLVLVRPDVDISERLVRLWQDDVLSQERGSVGHWIEKDSGPDVERQSKLAVDLIQVATHRQGDFVWDTLVPIVAAMELASSTASHLRRRFAQLYARCMADTINCGLDNPECDLSFQQIAENSYFDTMLFLQTLRTLRLAQSFERLTVDELRNLKSSSEWLWFRECYRQLVALGKDVRSRMGDHLRVVDDVERRQAAENLTHLEFSRALRISMAGLGVSRSRLTNALDMLRAGHEALGHGVVARFVNELEGLAEARSAVLTTVSKRRPRGIGSWLRESVAIGGAMINVLMLSANPHGTTRLRVDEECREIKRRIAEGDRTRAILFETEWAVRFDELQGHILRSKPNRTFCILVGTDPKQVAPLCWRILKAYHLQ